MRHAGVVFHLHVVLLRGENAELPLKFLRHGLFEQLAALGDDQTELVPSRLIHYRVRLSRRALLQEWVSRVAECTSPLSRNCFATDDHSCPPSSNSSQNFS